MRRFIIISFTLIISACLFGAEIPDKISFLGKIIDEEGMPMPGAAITIKGLKGGTISDIGGCFMLTLDKKDIFPINLVVQYVGYKTANKTIKNKHELDDLVIILKEDNYSLEDIVVIGYGSSSRKKLIGAVSKVTSSVIEKSTQEAPILSLQGNTTGVYITQGSGVPGAGNSSIIIRGKSTLSSQTQPLYIIDGVPFNSTSENIVGYASTGVFGLPDALSLINPSDIESIEILKDADATAIYGTRGTNGVVLITTKKGESGKVKVNVSFASTASFVSKKLDFLGTEEYLKLRKLAFQTDLANGYVTEKDYIPSKYPDLLLWNQDADYNWQEAMMGKTSWGHNAQAMISGGNSNTSFLISGSYYTSNTVVISPDRYSRWGARMNLSHSSSDKKFYLETGINLSGINMDSYSSSSPYTVMNTAPNTPIYGEDNGPYYIPDDPDYSSKTNFLAYQGNNKTVNFMGNMHMSYNITENFKAKISLGYNYGSSNQVLKYKRNYYNPYDKSKYNQAMYYTMDNSTILVEPQLQYVTGIFKGKITALLGGTYQCSQTIVQRMKGQNYPSDIFLDNASSAANIIQYMTPKTQTKTASLFARVNYDWDSRYLVNAIFRRDGSSRFGPEHRFGNFYSVGGAWLFGNENFIKNKTKFLSYGKLRFSYGITGNDGIGDYAYMAKYSTSSYPYEGNIGMSPTNIAVDNLHWETTQKMDIGLELGFFSDRLLFNAGWFRNRSYDLLTREYLPTQTGFSYLTANLNAEIDNKGWECEINTQNIKTRDFLWKTNFNITIPRNVLVKFDGLESSGYYNTYEIGKSIDLVRGYNYLGVDNQTGLPMFEDVDGDGKYSNKTDYVSLGTDDPDFYGGITNTFSYKGITLDINFYFRKKALERGYLWRYMYPIGMQYNVTKEMAENYWKTPGQDAKYPGLTTTTSSPVYTYFRDYLSYSQAAYSNGSYLRLKDVTLSYDFPARLLSTIKISALKLYIQGKNLFTITKYDSYDPETGDVAVPTLTSYVLGANLTF